MAERPNEAQQNANRGFRVVTLDGRKVAMRGNQVFTVAQLNRIARSVSDAIGRQAADAESFNADLGIAGLSETGKALLQRAANMALRRGADAIIVRDSIADILPELDADPAE